MPNAFVHIELNTDDVTAAKKFYARLFDWDIVAMGDDYTGIRVGKKGAGGGMQKKPMAEAPTLWLPYVEVDDVKKTIAKAKKLGANIQLEYMQLGDMGAIGVFVDPGGAPIGVWQSAPEAPKKAEKKKKKKEKKESKKKKKK